jgi:hypothetical protein
MASRFYGGVNCFYLIQLHREKKTSQLNCIFNLNMTNSREIGNMNSNKQLVSIITNIIIFMH